MENGPRALRKFFEAFKESTFPNNIRFTGNGTEALNMIFQIDYYSNKPRPDIIIFDLHTLRRKNGLKVLKEISKEKSIKCIPVVILTDLESEEKLEVYQNCPHLFITKPYNLDEYKKVVKLIEEFWLNYTSNKKI